MQEAPAPPLPVSPSGSLEPGLSSALADLLEPPGARKMKRAAAEQGPERPPFPLELTLWAYTPPSARAYIQYKLPAAPSELRPRLTSRQGPAPAAGLRAAGAAELRGSGAGEADTGRRLPEPGGECAGPPRAPSVA